MQQDLDGRKRRMGVKGHLTSGVYGIFMWAGPVVSTVTDTEVVASRHASVTPDTLGRNAATRDMTTR